MYPPLRRLAVCATREIGFGLAESKLVQHRECDLCVAKIGDRGSCQHPRMLNQLLLECDQKKRELEALLSKAGTDAPEKSAPPPKAANPLHDQVYSLQDSGKELLDICAATGLEKGEVELILGLRKMH